MPQLKSKKLIPMKIAPAKSAQGCTMRAGANASHNPAIKSAWTSSMRTTVALRASALISAAGKIL
jgi:hypothetical protein